MSIKIIAQIWPLDLPKDEKFVLIALADHAHDDGGGAYPSQRLLAWKTGYSLRQVRSALGSLERKGVIVRTRQPRFHFSAEYRITPSAALAKAPLERAAMVAALELPDGCEERQSSAPRAAKESRRPAIPDERAATIAAKPSEEPSEKPLKEPSEEARASATLKSEPPKKLGERSKPLEQKKERAPIALIETASAPSDAANAKRAADRQLSKIRNEMVRSRLYADDELQGFLGRSVGELKDIHRARMDNGSSSEGPNLAAGQPLP